MKFESLCKLLGLFVFVVLSAQSHAVDRHKPFDYYVMSLSWLPEFCYVRPQERQCGKGYGLVLHGLWPQYNKGYPESCSNERISNNLVRKYNGLYPSASLAIHEWKKHGTCAGLTATDYFQLSQRLKQGFITPDSLQNLTKPLRINRNELRKRVLAANPDLKIDTLAFSCTGRGRFLREIYVCYEKNGEAATSCSPELQKRSLRSCNRADMLVRNVR